MIRETVLFIKLFHLKSSSKSLIQDLYLTVQPRTETCPVCHSTGNCHIHAYYDRSLIDFEDGKKLSSSLCVPRVICDSCGHTHAILPDCIVPYKSFSLLFILQVLSLHFMEHFTKEALLEHFGISMKTLNSFLRLFRLHKRLWLGILRDLEVSEEEFLEQLVNGVYPEFAIQFYLRFHKSFLQSHRDPP